MPDFFPMAVYTLCFVTSSACCVMLARSYSRTRFRLLLWSSLCFFFLGLNNLIVIFDLLLMPDVSLQVPRSLLALAGVSVLLFGLIWETEEGR